jgi:tetratricopeptide (TPR) repeat protein
MQDFARCLEDINHYIMMEPIGGIRPWESPYLIRGHTLLYMNRGPEALANFQMARRLNRASFAAAQGIWLVYQMMGKEHLAAVMAEELVRVDARNIDGYCACAQSFADIGRLDEAQDAVKKALNLAPMDPRALGLMANLYVHLGKWDMASAQYEKAVGIAPNNPDVLLGRALFLAACPDLRYRDGSLARKLAGKVSQIPECRKAEYLMDNATIEAECGNFDEAVGLARKALEITPTESGNRAHYLEQLRLFEQRKPYRFQPGYWRNSGLQQTG